MATMLSKASEMRHFVGLRGPPLFPAPSNSRDCRNRRDAHSRASVANDAAAASRFARTVSGAYCSTSGGGLPAPAPGKGWSKRVNRSAGLWNLSAREANSGGRIAEILEPIPFIEAERRCYGREEERRFVLKSLPDDGEVVLVELPGESSEVSALGGLQGVVRGLADGTKVVRVDSSSIPAGASLAGGESDSAGVLAALPAYQPKLVWFAKSALEEDVLLNKAINAGILASAACFTLTTVFTVDHDYWHGWTLKEILQYAPKHNWEAYEALLKRNPILAKMMISGTVYALGDWIAQCFEGKSALEFDRLRMFRSGLVGFCLHGSMSHFYYRFCEWLFPFQGWWVLPLKVAFDQTAWSGLWNSIYFSTLGLLRFESPVKIWGELRTTFLPLLTAGWKLWPFAHLVTYGLIPVEQRLLWVDMVEIIWVTILALYSNQSSEARIAEHEELDILRGAEAKPPTNQ